MADFVKVANTNEIEPGHARLVARLFTILHPRRNEPDFPGPLTDGGDGEVEEAAGEA